MAWIRDWYRMNATHPSIVPYPTLPHRPMHVLQSTFIATIRTLGYGDSVCSVFSIAKGSKAVPELSRRQHDVLHALSGCSDVQHDVASVSAEVSACGFWFDEAK